MLVKRELNQQRSDGSKNAQQERQHNDKNKGSLVRFDEAHKPAQNGPVNNISAAYLLFVHLLVC